MFSAPMQACTVFALLISGLLSSQTAFAQTTLIDFNFQSTTLPAGVTSDGTISTGGSASPCTECSVGRINIALSGFLQMELSSSSVVKAAMKSSASGTRTVTVKYKKEGQVDFTNAGTIGVTQNGGWYELHAIFPALVSDVPIIIRLENAPSGGQFHIHDLFVQSNPNALAAAEILAFKIPDQLGSEVINSGAATVDINVPSGTVLTNVVPSQVTISNGAGIIPAGNMARDFSGGALVPYEVTAPNGTTKKNWTVKVTEVQSDAKDILGFKLSNDQLGSAIIDAIAGSVQVTMPEGANLDALVPVEFTISPKSSIAPLVTEPRNFSSPVVYVITAENGSTKNWTITVKDPANTLTAYEAEQALFTGTVDNNHSGFTGTGFINFLSEGENFINFTVCQAVAGNFTAAFRYANGGTADRVGKLYVNDVFRKDLAFSPTGSWTTWDDESETIAMLSGISNIRIMWDTSDGPNLDKLMLSGAPCAQYTLTVNATNSGSVSLSPQRFGNKYFEGETATLLAESVPSLQFVSWSGDASGSVNPLPVVMNASKSIIANFEPVPTYKLQVNVAGVGQVTLNPAGGEYPAGTVVALTATGILGSNFLGWGGDASGTEGSVMVTMTANKTVSASFSNSPQIDFDTPVGFASVNTGATYPNFNGPVTGGQHAVDTFWVNGPADFDALAWRLYYRNRAYNIGTPQNGVPKAPLVIVFKEGVYPEGTSSSSAWGNSMMTIQEQGDLTIIGQKNVVLKWGFNIKRSWNILIRNIHFQDYYDDGINIGESETHHIWIDHCTLGHPTTRPVNTEHPDGGVDSKSGASYITISWSLIRNSWKTSLVGHSDNNAAEDNGKLKVTYFANHFVNTNSRNPRVRFGEVHVLNNLNENVQLYGIAAAKDARVVAEGNFYLNTRWPMYADRTVADFRAVYGNNTDNVFTSKTGNLPCVYLKQFNNDYDDSGLPVITAQINPAMLNPGGRSVKFDQLNPELAFDPKSYYNYTPFAPLEVRTIVPMFAGADKVDFFNPPPPVPVVLVNHSLETFTQYEGIPSAPQSYTVSGSKLTEGLTITPPAHYEVSVDGNTWYGNASPLVLPHTGGVISSTPVKVRLNASSLGAYAGSIVHGTLNLNPSVTIPLSGNTIASIYPPGVHVVVAADGSGNYTSVQAAIDAAPANRTVPYVIFIKNGKYYEKVTVPSNKPFIHLVGESVANVILYYNTGASDPLPGGGTVGTQNSASFTINATDFAAFNITFANTYGDGTQAVAVLVNNDRAVFKNCRFLGNQDTLYVKGSGTPKHYFKDCYIDGNVDFIFGSSVAVFDSTVVYAKSRTNAGNSYITAANTPEGQAYGFVFRNNIIPENTGATRYYLGRPWQNSTGSNPPANNKTVFLSPILGTNTIRPEGWSVWDAGTNTSLITYAEFNPRDFSGNPVNVSQRVPWSLQLSETEANGYTLTNMFGNWDPCSIAGVCTQEARDIAVSNFRGKREATESVFEWNISWNKAGILYELFRAGAKNGPYSKVSDYTSVNDTAWNFKMTDELPGTGSSFFYYLKASKDGFAPHITDTIQISRRPTITVTGTLQMFIQNLGTPSGSQSLTLSGENLSGDITITPPVNYEISSDNGATWVAVPNTIAYAHSGNLVTSKTLLVRLNAGVIATHNGQLIFATPGGDSVYVALNGNTIAPAAGNFVTLQHWPFTSHANDLPADRAVGVTPSTPALERFFVSNGTQVPTIPAYSETYGMAFGASSNGDGTWTTAVGGPGGTLRRTHYVQFTVTADAGYRVRVDSLYVTGAFYFTSSNTRLAVVYSKSGFTTADSSDVFTSPGGFANPITLPQNNAGPVTIYPISFAGLDSIVLLPGETVTFRMYFSCGSSSAGRYATIKNVRVTGQTTLYEVLPLRLRSFEAVKQQDHIQLKWTTDRELQTSHFDIEKSTDANKFVSIGKVVAQNRSGVLPYSFPDHQIAPLNYYRLKMVDLDGSFNYSHVVLIKNIKGMQAFGLYPNPAKNIVNVLHEKLSHRGELVILDLAGRQVMRVGIAAGANQTAVNVSQLQAGMYMVTLQNREFMHAIKLLKE